MGSVKQKGIGKEAHRIGLVNYIVPADQVMPKAEELARKIAENGPVAVRKIKETSPPSGVRCRPILMSGSPTSSSALRRPEFFDREGLRPFATAVMPAFRYTS